HSQLFYTRVSERGDTTLARQEGEGWGSDYGRIDSSSCYAWPRFLRFLKLHASNGPKCDWHLALSSLGDSEAFNSRPEPLLREDHGDRSLSVSILQRHRSLQQPRRQTSTRGSS